MKNIVTIFRKQLKETMRNKEVLIQFLMFPVLAVFMTKSIQIEGMPPNFFVQLFSTMYVGMAPLVSMEAILSEEKEKNTLRVLLMADVTPWQYLAGVGGYVFLFCMLGAGVFCLLGGYGSGEAVLFLAVLGAGILVSAGGGHRRREQQSDGRKLGGGSPNAASFFSSHALPLQCPYLQGDGLGLHRADPAHADGPGRGGGNR